MVLALGSSHSRMCFRSVFVRLLQCSARAGVSQPTPVGKVHSTKPARRSSFGLATSLSPLCLSYSAQPTRSAPLVLHCVLRSTAPLLEALEHSFRASLAFSRVWSSARATWHSVFLPLGRSTFGHFALVLARSGPQRLRSSTVRFLGYFVPAVVHCACILMCMLLCMLLCMLSCMPR